MLKAGRIQTLTVSRVSEYGLYLADEEQNEVLLPNRYTSLTDKVGDRKEVFLYHDSEDRLVATTETPLLREGEAGYLRVVDKTAHGAFLDWGLHGKDLFLPNRNQQGGILAGHSYIVYLYEDNITGRCVATTKLKSFINNDLITVKPREEVSLLVASESEIGFRVIVNNRHWGMIYRNQIFRPVAVGDRLKGYVRRITEDNRIDVSLQQTGFAQVKDSAQTLLQLVRDNGGVPVVAHPGLNFRGREETAGRLLDRGAAGLEVFNNYHTPEQAVYFTSLALSKGASMTCGSDFHGKTKPRIAVGRFPSDSRFDGRLSDFVNHIHVIGRQGV